MFTLKFDTDNAAFHEFEGDSFGFECARILAHVADRVRGGDDSGAIFDANGNRVGAWGSE